MILVCCSLREILKLPPTFSASCLYSYSGSASCLYSYSGSASCLYSYSGQRVFSPARVRTRNTRSCAKMIETGLLMGLRHGDR
jgi:hypothetical protein